MRWAALCDWAEHRPTPLWAWLLLIGLGMLLGPLLTGCSGHRPIVIVPPVVKVHTWTLPIEAENDDLFCAQTSTPIYRPCWTVGYLRGVMVSVKAE